MRAPQKLNIADGGFAYARSADVDRVVGRLGAISF